MYIFLPCSVSASSYSCCLVPILLGDFGFELLISLGQSFGEDSLSLRVKVCPSREDCLFFCQVSRSATGQDYFKPILDNLKFLNLMEIEI